jgi:hypothetical protein
MGGNNSNLSLGQQVVIWAQGKVGKKVGKGECWDLAEAALKQAGAQTSNDLGPMGEDADYVWGDSIAIKDVEPGDVLQFRDYEVKTTTVTKYVWDDGSSETIEEEDIAERGHHTAVVNGMPDSSGVVKTLDQHVKPLGKVVQNKMLHTRNVPAASRSSTSKRKHPSTKKLESVKVRTTVTIEVSGQVWAYRPKAQP